MRTYTTRKLGIIFALATLATARAQDTQAAKPDQSSHPDIEVTVSETAVGEVSRIGKTSFDEQDISRQIDSSGDLNQIARTVAGVQFSNTTGQLSESSILDLSPARLSINGGRTYDNSFLIDGLSTNSVLDTTNTNMHDAQEVVAHPQTTFVNPALVGAVTIYTSDIPAEYGNFTGGVVSAKLRDPARRFGFESSYSYTSDAWVQYLVDDSVIVGDLPNKPRFSRETSDFSVDLPLGKQAGLLLSYSRRESQLKNTQRHAYYGNFSTEANTSAENFAAKTLWKISPETTLRLTSLYSPYSQENYEQSPKFQDNDGWANIVELTHESDAGKWVFSTGYSWTSTDRDQENDFYVYKNIGRVDWVAASLATAYKGGSGDLISRQTDLPASARFEKLLTKTGKWALGVDGQSTRARKSRPLDNNSYRHQTASTVKLDPRVTSADGAGDLTVIEGEQALNYRILYPAYDARVTFQTADAWTEWSDKGKIGTVAWEYRTGLRADYDDFLRNTNVAPRVTGEIAPLSWLKLHAGVNRYYTRPLLSYKLRESYPGTYIYTRTGTLTNGKLVYSSKDWKLYSQTRTTAYGENGANTLDTPYADEFSTGAKIDLRAAGELHVVFIKRHAEDEFSRDAGTKTTYTKDDGTTATSTVYRLTNAGFTDYTGTELTWTKRWNNHRFNVNTTFAKTKTATTTADSDPDYYDAYNESAMEALVSYNGELIARKQIALERANFARPNYVNFLWSADWFNKRFKTDLLGRWEGRYDRIVQNGTTTVSGTKYDLYENRQQSANFITDLNLGFVLWKHSRFGSVELNVKVGNLFNQLPHVDTDSLTTSDPYEEGRSFWSSIKYSF